MSRCGNVINCGPRSPTTLAEVFLVTKTTRRGSFLASEPNPVSILFFSIFVSGLDGEAAILLHAPELNPDKDCRRQRKDDHMQHIKTQESVFADNVAPQK